MVFQSPVCFNKRLKQGYVSNSINNDCLLIWKLTFRMELSYNWRKSQKSLCPFGTLLPLYGSFAYHTFSSMYTVIVTYSLWSRVFVVILGHLILSYFVSHSLKPSFSILFSPQIGKINVFFVNLTYTCNNVFESDFKSSNQ